MEPMSEFVIRRVMWTQDKRMTFWDSARKENALEILVDAPNGKQVYAYVFYAGIGKGDHYIWTLWTYSGYLFPGSAFAEWAWVKDRPDELSSALNLWLSWLEDEYASKYH